MASPVRQRKVAERIKQEVSTLLLTEIKDPRIGMVSVVRVKVSADLRNALVFVSVLGGAPEKSRTMKALQRARGYVQSHVAKNIDLRFAPILKFQLDESIERSVRISKLLEELVPGPPAEDDDEDGEDADADAEGEGEGEGEGEDAGTGRAGEDVDAPPEDPAPADSTGDDDPPCTIFD